MNLVFLKELSNGWESKSFIITTTASPFALSARKHLIK